ncbi:MAG: hypothetical protein C0620_00705 [Desulfuromonas sp.]|nr:MAG: hypothetical protein C0620_00705 [Desulfuromonas sp.]
MKISRLSVLTLLLLLFCFAMAQATPITKEVTLYPGSKKNPYSLFFPVEVTQPGQIQLSASVQGGKRLPKSDCMLELLDAEVLWDKLSDQAWRDWLEKGTIPPMARTKVSEGVLKSRRHAMAYGNRPGRVVYNVDMTELSRYQGRYVVVLKNTGSSEAVHQLLVRLPGDSRPASPDNNAQAQTAARQRCDLTVTKISTLKSSGQLAVTVANEGAGGIPARAYEVQGEHAVTLMLERNGKSLGGVTLPVFDPRHKLMQPGGRVTYAFNLAVNGPTMIKVTVDASGKLREENEGNNSRVQQFE